MSCRKGKCQPGLKESSARNVKHTGAISKRTLKKETPKKRVTRRTKLSTISVRGIDSSDEEFLPKSSTSKRSTNSFLHCNAINQKEKRCVTSTTASNMSKSDKRRSLAAGNIYQISDSSDEEQGAAGRSISDIQTINLDETLNFQENSILDVVLNEAVSKSNNINSQPSTSNATAVCDNSNKMPDFVNNLLHSNKDLLDDNYLKSVRELNVQTDELIARSWDLINESSHSVSQDSVIYLSTEQVEDLDNKSVKQSEQNNTNIERSSAVLSSPEGSQKIKPHCPICLEQLGEQPVSSTICGHIFCTPCIKNCIQTLKQCPSCRKRLTLKMVHPLFLF